MGIFKIENPGDQPVWVNTSNCKACDICVSVCPSGVLSMRYEISSTLGAMIAIEHPEACIGCSECELSCPDFAIFVAERSDLKAAGISFAKLTDEAKERQAAIKANNYYSIEQGAR
jgi:2-oxoglutarate ferredoxin oxidoreductase subunit delta